MESKFAKNLLIVIAGRPSKKFVLETARQIYDKIIIADEDQHWSRDLADYFIPLHDSLSKSDTIEYILKKIADQNLKIHGIYTWEEYAVPAVAQLSTKLGLNNNEPQAFEVARDKYKLRLAMKKLGLPYPEFYMIEGLEQLIKIEKTLKFPLIIKPVDSAGAYGAGYVSSISELQSAFTQTKKLIQSNPHTKLDVHSGQIILESYLDGKEVDIDIVLLNSTCIYANIIDNETNLPPSLSQLTWNCPSELPEDVQKKLVTNALEILNTLGFYTGVYHIEAKFTSEGCRIIEINSRIGGAYVYHCHKEVWGVDLLVCALNVATNQNPECKPFSQPKKYIYGEFIFPTKSGTIYDLNSLADIAKWENITAKMIQPQTFPLIVNPPSYGTAFTDSLGFIEVEDESLELARKRCKQYIKQITERIEIYDS